MNCHSKKECPTTIPILSIQTSAPYMSLTCVYMLKYIVISFEVTAVDSKDAPDDFLIK